MPGSTPAAPTRPRPPAGCSPSRASAPDASRSTPTAAGRPRRPRAPARPRDGHRRRWGRRPDLLAAARRRGAGHRADRGQRRSRPAGAQRGGPRRPRADRVAVHGRRARSPDRPGATSRPRYRGHEVLRDDDLELNLAAHEARLEGQIVEFTFMEFELLKYLVTTRAGPSPARRCCTACGAMSSSGAPAPSMSTCAGSKSSSVLVTRCGCAPCGASGTAGNPEPAEETLSNPG